MPHVHVTIRSLVREAVTSFSVQFGPSSFARARASGTLGSTVHPYATPSKTLVTGGEPALAGRGAQLLHRRRIPSAAAVARPAARPSGAPSAAIVIDHDHDGPDRH